MSSSAILSQNKKRSLSAEIGAKAYREIMLYGVAFIALALITTVLITRNIVVSVRKLKVATRKIAEGEFEDFPVVKSKDELGELSISFTEMARRLKKLEQICIDMNPLTRLPGNMAIEATLRKRLEGGLPLAFCHFDIDNFKAFADKYGYGWGSEVIKMTAQVISSAVAKYGSQDDFVGHVGGDDFVVITTPNQYEKICRSAIEAFDRTAPDFYSSEDRNRGFIRGMTRQGEAMDFPLMTISIGVVTIHEAMDPLQVGEMAAELKESAKSLPGSNYVVDEGVKQK
jgi:diguanylate cyclase (GGDEF)-like protein